MSEKLGQEPAFPTDRVNSQQGISKRLYVACAAMQGMLANSNYKDSQAKSHKTEMIELAYELADELLKQESNE